MVVVCGGADAEAAGCVGAGAVGPLSSEDDDEEEDDEKRMDGGSVALVRVQHLALHD